MIVGGTRDDELWPIVEEAMNNLLMPALVVIGDAFACYDPVPFDLVEDDFVYYPTS